jgi:hypothetical protein
MSQVPPYVMNIVGVMISPKSFKSDVLLKVALGFYNVTLSMV